MTRLKTKDLIAMADPMYRAKKFAEENGFRIEERTGTETGGAGFVYFGSGDNAGRISWSVIDGELAKGASYGFPTERQQVDMMVLVVLYARAKGWTVNLES